MSWIMLEYLCPERHRTASLESRSDVRTELECDVCGAVATRTISAPRIKTTEWGAVTRASGVQDERPPGVPDTSRLADGENYNEWRESYTKESRVRDEDLERATRRVMSLTDDKVI